MATGGVSVLALTEFFPPVSVFPGSHWNLKEFHFFPSSLVFPWVQSHMYIESSQLLPPCFVLLLLFQGSHSDFLPNCCPAVFTSPFPTALESGFYWVGSLLPGPHPLSLPTSWFRFGFHLALTESHTCWFPFCIIFFLLFRDFWESLIDTDFKGLLLLLEQDVHLAFRMFHKTLCSSLKGKRSIAYTPYSTVKCVLPDTS